MLFRHFAILSVSVVSLSGCTANTEVDQPPPDARRPILKSEVELAAERDQRIRVGEVVPSDAPMIEAEKKKFTRTRPEPPPEPAETGGSIQSDMLLVNKNTLTVAEVIYPLRDRVAEARQGGASREGLEKQLDRWIRGAVQQEVGALLVFEKATAELDEQRLKQLELMVKDDEAQRITREFGGSSAKLVRHLERYGLTLPQYRERLKRQMVVRGYTRDILMPQIVVRREEIFAFYKANPELFNTAGSRELLMIESPFEKFLPADVTWRSASGEDRTRAKLAAVRNIRAAASALQSGRAFAEVAAEFSRGPHKDEGGSWGMIGKPLAAPWDTLTSQVFSFNERQFSEPVELDTGWYIVGCGAIQAAQNLSLTQAQEKIREELIEQRFNKLASDYVMKLAAKATMSSLDNFLRAAVARAASPDWPLPGE